MKDLIIRMKGDVAEILLYDQIGEFFGDGISAKTFLEQIKAVKAKTINLRINWPGGSVTEGVAMMSALDNFKGTIEVDIDGLAASAAAFVAMAGDVVRMPANAMIMVHEAWAGVMGNASDFRRTADLLDKINGQQLEAFMRRAKVSKDEMAKMIADETWLMGQEAFDAGLADEVTDHQAIAASFDLSKFKYKNVPQRPGPSAQDLAAFEQRREWFKAICT